MIGAFSVSMRRNRTNISRLFEHVGALSGEGAFPPKSFYCPEDNCTFSKDDIAGVVEYARNRGIRVILEMDVPGHTRSWGLVCSLTCVV